jgi:sulfate adenylyltransferase
MMAHEITSVTDMLCSKGHYIGSNVARGFARIPRARCATSDLLQHDRSPARSLVMELESVEHSGACVWLTGLSGAGKSTTALALHDRLRAAGMTAVVFDGDALRRTAMRPLGFSKADRDANVLRAARLACEAADGGAIAICALISPYRATRATARELVGTERFVEVFIDTPVRVCEDRDPQGLYRRFRDGAVQGVTGLDAPYEPPLAPELTLQTEGRTVDENVSRIIAWLSNHQLKEHPSGP